MLVLLIIYSGLLAVGLIGMFAHAPVAGGILVGLGVAGGVAAFAISRLPRDGRPVSEPAAGPAVKRRVRRRGGLVAGVDLRR